LSFSASVFRPVERFDGFIVFCRFCVMRRRFFEDSDFLFGKIRIFGGDGGFVKRADGFLDFVFPLVNFGY
jgi:hypothetical protein